MDYGRAARDVTGLLCKTIAYGLGSDAEELTPALASDISSRLEGQAEGQDVLRVRGRPGSGMPPGGSMTYAWTWGVARIRAEDGLGGTSASRFSCICSMRIGCRYNWSSCFRL